MPSSRSAVDPFLAMDVMVAAKARAALGEDVLHMEVGEPGHQAPLGVREAAKRAIDRGLISYTPALGLPDLRARIARHYRDTYNVSISHERIAITTGSSAGFVLSFLAAFDPGDRIGLPVPGYPAYRNVIKALGLIPVDIPVRADNRYVLSPDDVLSVHQSSHDEQGLAGLLVASPANPSGTMMQPAALAALVAVCDAQNIRFLSDEIYHGLVFDGATETALAHSDKAIILNSFSKYYCMTGWRIGWMVLPEDLVRPVERLAQSLYISAPYISQIAAMEAFDATAELESIKAQYARSRAKLLTALPAMGFTKLHPADGAFYIYCDASHITADTLNFSKVILGETGVAATPGVDFDPVSGQTTMRFSYAGAEHTIDRAIDVLGVWLKG